MFTRFIRIANAIRWPLLERQYPASGLTPMSVPVLARQRPAAGGPRVLFFGVPRPPARGSEGSRASHHGFPRAVTSRRPMALGETAFARERPEPSTTRALN